MKAVELIREAVHSGSRRVAAARILGISLRTLQRWESSGCRGDQRCGPHGVPENALSEAERALGIVPSFSRPRVSDDNPYSEALFRTVKYRPGYPSTPFRRLEDARGWVAAFVWGGTKLNIVTAPSGSSRPFSAMAASISWC